MVGRAADGVSAYSYLGQLRQLFELLHDPCTLRRSHALRLSSVLRKSNCSSNKPLQLSDRRSQWGCCCVDGQANLRRRHGRHHLWRWRWLWQWRRLRAALRNLAPQQNLSFVRHNTRKKIQHNRTEVAWFWQAALLYAIAREHAMCMYVCTYACMYGHIRTHARTVGKLASRRRSASARTRRCSSACSTLRRRRSSAACSACLRSSAAFSAAAFRCAAASCGAVQ